MQGQLSNSQGCAVPRHSSTAVKAFTLTEMAIVLGILGLILAGLWTAATAVYANMRINKLTSALLTISQNVRSLYASTNNIVYGGDITTSVIMAGGVPADMVRPSCPGGNGDHNAPCIVTP